MSFVDNYQLRIAWVAWLKDNSTGFTNTSQLIDMTLDIIVNVLKTGIISKAADILSFLFKSHIYSNIDNIHKLFSSAKNFNKYFKDATKESSTRDNNDG